MAFKCKIGLHSWDGCKCSECEKPRNEQHDWNGCKCSKCGQIRDEQHDWSKDCETCSKCDKTRESHPSFKNVYGQWQDGIITHDWTKDCDKCSKCAKTRDDYHFWSEDCEKCSECSKTRDNQHDWSKDCKKCSICGKSRDKRHDWSKDCEKCSICGKSRMNQHDWSKDCDKCSKCDTTRDDYHYWFKDCEKCSKCSKTRDNQHDWSKDCKKCSECGRISDNKHDWTQNCEICSKCGMTTSNKHNWINNYQKCSICGVEFIEWVEIPGGTFMMGSPTNEKDRNEDEVQHKVTIRSFRMSKYAVTASQYSLFTKVKGIKNHGYGKGQEPIEIDDYHFADILAFADWMGCRLPTEAEWEYACRAGSTTPFNTGNILLTSMANFGGENPYANRSYNEDPLGYESRLSSTCVKSVGCYPPNAWGLYDMHGNVYEWCSDWYGDYVIEDQVNPQGPPTGEFHVCRGGSHWPYSSRCRSAARHNFANKSYDGGIPIGFRLVLEI